jgi:hypothetical protein
MGADAVKHITEILKRINLTQLTAGDKAVDGGCSFGTGVTSGEEPVPAADGNRSKDPLCQIVVDVEVAILNVLIQRYPLSTGITYCLAYRTLG